MSELVSNDTFFLIASSTSSAFAFTCTSYQYPQRYTALQKSKSYISTLSALTSLSPRSWKRILSWHAHFYCARVFTSRLLVHSIVFEVNWICIVNVLPENLCEEAWHHNTVREAIVDTCNDLLCTCHQRLLEATDQISSAHHRCSRRVVPFVFARVLAINGPYEIAEKLPDDLSTL